MVAKLHLYLHHNRWKKNIQHCEINNSINGPADWRNSKYVECKCVNA
jgi:hypothetical protein